MNSGQLKVLFFGRAGVSPHHGLLEFLNDQGVVVRLANIRLPEGKIGRYLPSKHEIAAIKRTINDFSPDIIVFNDENSRAGLLTILRANKTTAKPVVWFRGAIGGYNSLSPIDRYLLRHRDLARLVVRSYAMINAWGGSFALAHLLQSRCIECCPHIISQDCADADEIQAFQARFGIGPDDIVIGTIANARPIKNIEFAARAVSQVNAARRVLFLYIGGHDEALRVRLEKINPGNTILTGVIPNAGRYARAFDIFVSPTKQPGEGFGLALAEAMASSVPVIATHFGGATDIVEHGETGFLLPETMASWVHALETMVNDPLLCRRMGEAGQLRVRKRFSLEAVAPDFLRILKDAVAERAARHSGR